MHRYAWWSLFSNASCRFTKPAGHIIISRAGPETNDPWGPGHFFTSQGRMDGPFCRWKSCSWALLGSYFEWLQDKKDCFLRWISCLLRCSQDFGDSPDLQLLAPDSSGKAYLTLCVKWQDLLDSHLIMDQCMPTTDAWTSSCCHVERCIWTCHVTVCHGSTSAEVAMSFSRHDSDPTHRARVPSALQG